MISWLLVIILSYFFFSLAFLGDKMILSGAPKPALYTFYVGALSLLVVFFIPFIKFSIPNYQTMGWIIAEAIVYIAGLYAMFRALEKFEVSKVMTTIGATQPIFVFFLVWLFWGLENITGLEIFAFFLLLVGSIGISFEKNANKNRGYINITIIASILFSLDYIFQKLVFLDQPFLQGFVWMRLASFVVVLFLLFSKNLRKELFVKKENVVFDKKISTIFVCSQSAGGIANGLQGAAIFLAPTAFLPIINALRGIQYVFLFLLTLFVSYAFPKILQEKNDRTVIIRKSISIIVIAAGLALAVLY